MTLAELKETLNTEPPENLDLEVMVWLPGTRISLRYIKNATLIKQGNVLLLEGNVHD